MPTRTIEVYTADGSTRVEVRRVGPLGRVLIALVAIALLTLAFLIALPILIVTLALGAAAFAWWRVRLALARRRELGAGRRNVRVVRRGRP